MVKVEVGTEFRHIIGDCNALWKVTKLLPADACEAVVIKGPDDPYVDHEGYTESN